MLALTNCRILTMTDCDFEKGYILINGDKIVEVGDMKDFNSIKEKYDHATIAVLDLPGKYVLPGFVDAHCHVGLWEDSVGFEGEDGNEATDPVTPHLRAIDGIYHMDRAFEEAIQSGVTTAVCGPGSANVIGGQFAAIKTYGKTIDEMVIKQPVAVKVAFGENPKSVYAEKKQMPSTRMATAALLRESLYKAKEYMESMEEYKRNPEEFEKPEFDMKMEALIPVLQKKIPLKAHAHRADDILTALRIAKEFNVNITIEHGTEGYLIADILKNENIGVVAGPLLTDRSKVELRNQTMKNPAILSNAGVKVAIMTDHPCVPLNLLLLCAAMAAKEGMNEHEALKAITINAAELCGIAERVGSIEEGKDADLVVFEGHPFDLRSRVLYTFINGNIVYSFR